MPNLRWKIMCSIGDIITLRGLSRKGKQRIHDLGRIWKIVGIGNNVVCCGGGSAMLVEPCNHADPNKFVRWVAFRKDKDMELVYVS